MQLAILQKNTWRKKKRHISIHGKMWHIKGSYPLSAVSSGSWSPISSRITGSSLMGIKRSKVRKHQAWFSYSVIVLHTYTIWLVLKPCAFEQIIAILLEAILLKERSVSCKVMFWCIDVWHEQQWESMSKLSRTLSHLPLVRGIQGSLHHPKEAMQPNLISSF